MLEDKPAETSGTDEASQPVELDDNGNPIVAELPTEHRPEPRTIEVKSHSRWSRFRHWYKTKKKLSVPLTILILIGLMMLIPQTRYILAGTVYKKDFAVAVTDSVTHSPVSGATVTTGSTSAETDGNGKAVLHLSVGKHNLVVTKKYYADQTTDATVPLLNQKSAKAVALQATGRQVKITVTNIFNHQPLANVEIKLSDTNSKTDTDGNATGVVSESTKSAKATLNLDGYNSKEVTVQASDSEVKQNDLTMTPSGKIYFLSKLSGKIDVVKTDLDGQQRQVVLAGIGTEQDSNTVLLASRDWKYLALLSKRDSASPKLYLLETASDKLTTIEDSKGTITPIGWDDNNFLYDLDRSNVKDWESNKASIKSFNATNQQSILLDNTAGVGTDQNHYAYEAYPYGGSSFYLIDHNLIYSKTWQSSFPDDSLLSGKTNKIQKINVNGSGHQLLKAYGVDKYIESFLYKPRTIYFQEPVAEEYYVYTKGNFSQNPSIRSDYLKYQDDGVASTYLLSPSSDQTFWYESRDGKNTLLIGDVDGEGGKSVGRTSDYIPYGWYSNEYLLVSKDSSELYVIPKEGLSDTIKAFKITDYHKPAHNFYGYGGGYGGL